MTVIVKENLIRPLKNPLKYGVLNSTPRLIYDAENIWILKLV